MNTQSLKQNIEIIANVGVLMGIILPKCGAYVGRGVAVIF